MVTPPPIFQPPTRERTLPRSDSQNAHGGRPSSCMSLLWFFDDVLRVIRERHRGERLADHLRPVGEDAWRARELIEPDRRELVEPQVKEARGGHACIEPPHAVRLEGLGEPRAPSERGARAVEIDEQAPEPRSSWINAAEAGPEPRGRMDIALLGPSRLPRELLRAGRRISLDVLRQKADRG